MSSSIITSHTSSPSGSIPPSGTGQWMRPPTILTMGGNPKPVATQPDLPECATLVPGILNDAKDFTNAEILENLKRASILMRDDTGADYWTTDDGQAELLRRIQLESKPPSTTTTAPGPWEIWNERGRSVPVGLYQGQQSHAREGQPQRCGQ